METFRKLLGSLLALVYHCFDRVVIQGYPRPADSLRPHQSPRHQNPRHPEDAPAGGAAPWRYATRRLADGADPRSHTRRGKNTQFPLADLFRQSVYSRLAAYEDVNDAQRLSQDPTFRLIGSDKIW